MKSHHIHKKTLGMFLVISCLASGCEDKLLNQARQVSATSQQLNESFPALANDYVETCFRTSYYQIIVTNPSKDFDILRQEKIKSCTKPTKEEAKQAFIFENKIIATYLGALGALAGVDNFSFDTEVSQINVLIKNQTGEDLTTYKGGVFSQLLSFILKSSTEKMAADEIKAQVKKLNPSFQSAICNFKNTFQEAYKANLDAEKEALDDYYRTTIKIMIQRSRNEFEVNALNVQSLRQVLYGETPSKVRLPIEFAALPAVYEFDKQWREEDRSHQIHYLALNKYVQILDTIASAHAALDLAAGGQGLNQGTFDKECNPPKLSQAKVKRLFGTDDDMLKSSVSTKAQLKSAKTYLDRLETEIKELQYLTLNHKSKIEVNHNEQRSN